jgi:hypothetical protein
MHFLAADISVPIFIVLVKTTMVYLPACAFWAKLDAYRLPARNKNLILFPFKTQMSVAATAKFMSDKELPSNATHFITYSCPEDIFHVF